MEYNVFVLAGAVCISMLVGVLTGIFGIGGGFLTTPALMLLLKIPGPIAVGTDVAMIFVTSSFGIYKRRNTNSIDSKLALIIGFGSGIGVLIGVAALEMLKNAKPVIIFGKEHLAVQLALLIGFFLLLIAITVLMVTDYVRSNAPQEKHTGLLQKFLMKPFVSFKSLGYSHISLLPVVLLGVIAGFLTGLLGIGGGVIMLPCLIYLLGQKAFAAAGTSLMIVWLSTFVGITGHIRLGNVDIILLIAMLLGGLTGTHVGTHVGLKLTHRKICLYFSCIIATSSILVGIKVIDMLL